MRSLALPGIPRPPVMHICNRTKLAEFSKIQVDVFLTKNTPRKLQWDLTKLYSKFICLMKESYLKWRGLAEVSFLSQGAKKMFFKCTLSIQAEFTFYRLRMKPLKIMWTSCMQSRLIRVALSVLSTFSCILFDKDFKLQNAINQRLLGASSWMNWISVEKTVQ